MARPKKEDSRESALMVPVEQFTRTRDQVIMSLSNLQGGLTHVQNGLTDLLRAYMAHTASVLAGGAETSLENLQLPEHIAESATAATEAAQAAGRAIAQAVQPVSAVATKKRKRAQKEKDPNRPKRPLTAAFLYAQNARGVVRKDLEEALGPGDKLEPNAVNLEVTKRWNEMPEDQKEKWKQSYRESLEKYKEEDAAYRASKGIEVPAEIPDEEEPSDEAEAGALDSDVSSDSEDESGAVIEATPAPKAPTPPAKTPRPSKRAKTAHTPQVNGSSVPVPIAPAAGNTPVPLPSKTQVPLPSSSTDTPAPAKSKADKKKKDKAPQPIAPAPAATKEKETTPEEPKKKRDRSKRNGDVVEAEKEVPATEPKKKRDRSKRKSEGAAV